MEYNYLIDPIGENRKKQSILMQQLSSGRRIVNSWMDAGGLAVANKLASTVSRSTIAANNLSTSNSFLQTQDGVLKSASEILDRMGQLKAVSQGVFGDNTGAYQKEYEVLREELASLSQQTFNGVDLFASPSGSLPVIGDPSASTSFLISQPDLDDAVSDIGNESQLANLATSNFTDALQNVASLRATNGAQQSRVDASFDLMRVQITSKSAAYSAIMDVDLARTSTDLAVTNIYTASGAAVFNSGLLVSSRVGMLIR